MIEFKPFAGVRPSKSKARQMTAQNIDCYWEEAGSVETRNDEESFLDIVNSSIDDSNLSEEEKSKYIRSKFEELLEKEILLKDKKSYYIYEQLDSEGNATIGIIGIVSINDVKEKLIKKHEAVIPEKEQAFFEYLKIVKLQTDPIVLTFPENQSIELIVSMTTRNTPILEFEGGDGKIHKLWKVKDRLVMMQLKSAVEKLPALYVADGHDRLGGAEAYTDYMRSEDDEFFGGEAYNYTMAVLVLGNFLKIKDYNRLVKDLNGLTPAQILKKIEGIFTIVEKGKEPYYPLDKHHISMYLDGEYYALYVNQEYRGTPVGLGELDTYLLEEYVMKPVLGIDNCRINERVAFEKGTADIEGILKMKKKVDSGEYAIAFGFYPVAIRDLKLIADEGKISPPNSTFIEPKFLSSLTIFDLTD